MPLRIGRFELHEIRDGTFALDGGAMFGIVPRTLWEKHHPPDARNRIRLALRCLLVVFGDRRVLVDTGMGSLWTPKQQDIYDLDRAAVDLERDLARAGFSREDVTDVVLSHLHFAQAGGAVSARGGGFVPAFPNATYHVQRRNWTWSQRATDRDRGSFRPEVYRALEASGNLHLLEGAHELAEGLEVFLSEGHTVGLQLVRINDGDKGLIYCGDLVPTTAHLRSAWSTAYDLYPLTLIEEKRVLLAQAMEEQWVLFLMHDPKVAACTVKEEDGEVVVNQVVPM